MPQIIDIRVGSERGSITLSMVQNWLQQNQEVVVEYYVVADNSTQDFAYILANTTGLPKTGSRLYSMFCMETTAEDKGSVVHFLTGVTTRLWIVHCKFSTQMRDPNDTIPDVGWDGEIDKEHLEQDVVTGAKITTTAGEPIFMDRPVIYQTLTVHRKGPWPFDPSLPVRFVSRVNRSEFYGFPTGTCLMMPIRAEEDTQDNQRVVWENYTIKVKIVPSADGLSLEPNTWQARPLNCGYYYRPSPGAAPEVYRDRTGQPAIVNLDEDGTILQNSQGVDLIFQSFRGGTVYAVRDQGVGFGALIPQEKDIGSTLVIPLPVTNPSVTVPLTTTTTTLPPGVIPGEYVIADVQSWSGFLWWILTDCPVTTPGSPTDIGSFEIQRSPIFLYFNRFNYAEFSFLNLGPY